MEDKTENKEYIYRQRNAPRPMTGRRFLMGAAGIVLALALCQTLVNALIALTGAGLFNALYYLLAVAMLVAFMRGTVASSVYQLSEDALTLQSLLGDSTTSVVEAPLSAIRAVRPVTRGENLHLLYAQVTAVDAASKPGLRMRAAFIASLVSARLSRRIAGKRAAEELGYVAVFEEEGRLRALVFRPDAGMREALSRALPEACGADDRNSREPLTGIYARALQRAFPAAYPHVSPLVGEEQMAWARGEIARQREERKREREEGKKRREARAAAKAKKRGKGKRGDGWPKATDMGAAETLQEAPKAEEASEAEEANEPARARRRIAKNETANRKDKDA